MNARSLAAALLVLALGMLVPLPAQAGDRLLGSTRLTKIENDTDVLVFRKCRQNIQALQLRVHRGQVEVERLWIRYANGRRQELEVRERIAKGGRTRWIDVRGLERCIKVIGIIGDTELSADQARVEIWGRGP